jgi:hypothetical protein
MKKRIAVCDLAGQLGVSSRELIGIAQSLGINVIRAAATLTSGQEFKLREAVANDRARMLSRAAALAAAPPPPPRAPSPRDTHKSGICECCGWRFLYEPLNESHQICKDCRNHFEQPDESYVQTLTRHEDHVAKARKMAEAYREKSYELTTERDEAYAKRDKWMAALVEIVVAHGPAEEHDGCACGAEEFPCVTRRHLRMVNRGIYNRCEELEAMNEDQFNRILYGTDYTFFKDWDDGVA